MNFRNLSLSATVVAALISANNTKIQAYTADDFCGYDKFCSQLFWGSDMIGRDIIQYGNWSVFEKINDKQIKVQSFCGGGEVTFTIDGDYLIIDKTEMGNSQYAFSNAQTVKDMEGKNCKLEVVKKYSKDIKGKTYWHFGNTQKEQYKGLITAKNGILTVTFDTPDRYLQFHERTTNASTGQVMWHDWLNTYSKVEIEILPANGTYKEHPIYVEQNHEDGTLTIHNLMGTARRYAHDGNTRSVLMPEEFTATLTANRSIHMESGEYTGTLSAEGEAYWLMTDGTYLWRPKSVTLKNETVEFSEADAPDFEVSFGHYRSEIETIEPGWHKRLGGSLQVDRTVFCGLDWAQSESPTDSDDANEIDNGQGFTFVIDETPDAELSTVEYLYHGSAGIQVSGRILDVTNDQMIDSFDVLAYRGTPSTVEENENFNDAKLGHNDALIVAHVEKEDIADEFRQITYFKNMPASWQDLRGNEQLTFYLRMNLTNEFIPLATNVRAKAPAATQYGFTSMSEEGALPYVITAVEELDAQSANIEAGDNCIIITGSDCEVSVNTLQGTTIYCGGDTKLTVTPGVYIVKAGKTARKLLVK
ncbi:MAG: hypothetical protein K2M87_06280 [Muribaculaceae bacterium]|nr:hypothetical protein [Muribaculaceae bacterium]